MANPTSINAAQCPAMTELAPRASEPQGSSVRSLVLVKKQELASSTSRASSGVVSMVGGAHDAVAGRAPQQCRRDLARRGLGDA